MVNEFGEAAERILIHEWTPQTHDLATLPIARLAKGGTTACHAPCPLTSRSNSRLPAMCNDVRASGGGHL